LFEGSRGIGKSSLLTSIRALAVASGTEVLTASGRRRERHLERGVILQLLESGLAPRGSDGWLAALTSPNGSLTTLHSVYRLVAESSTSAPLTLLVNDVELADATSLQILLYLAERLDELPVALVLASGAVSSRQVPELLRDIARHRLTTRRRLAPLTRDATARRLATTWRLETDVDGANAIHDASGGNPFLVDALAAELAAADASLSTRPVHERTPVGVADWALPQAESVHPDAPALVQAVAMLGQGCEMRHAAALAGLEPEKAVMIVDALCEAEVLAGVNFLSFVHPVVATCVAAEARPGTRALMNLNVARLLLDEDAPAERVASHLLAAPSTGSARVVDALCRASTEALERGATATAVGYLRRALAEPPADERRAHVVLELGQAEAMAGEPQGAARLHEAVERRAAALEDPAAALTTGRTLVALGRAHDALAVFERGLAAAGDEDREVAAALRAGHVAAWWLTMLPNGAERRLGEPPRSVSSAGDRALLAVHAIERAVRIAPRSEVEDLALRALGDGELLAAETADGLPYYLATGALVYAERLEQGEAALTAAVADARRRGSVLGLGTASHIRAVVILLRGRLVDAALEAGRALAVESHGWRFGLGGARVVLATTLMERGDLVAARRHLAAAESGPGVSDTFRLSLKTARGRAHLLAGDADAALASFLACGSLADRAGTTNPAVAAWRSGAGRALAAQGDVAEAQRLIEIELSLAREFGAPAPVAHALRALAATHDPARARDALEAAVEVLEASEALLERANALVEFGSALRRSGRRRDAKRPLVEGLALAEDCSAGMLVAHARQELKLAGARPRRTAVHGEESLTEREREVASLAADGLSNRRIAETLVVTMKTVEWHLNQTYRKLGVRSRGELRESLSPRRDRASRR
jgi:DNA-binding NarL/FixJ family response regulator